MEEVYFFPGIDELTQKPAVTAKSRERTHSLHGGLERVQKYVANVKPIAFRWEGLREVLDSFVPDFIQHFRDEIKILLDLQSYNSDALAAVWQRIKDDAKRATHPHLYVC